MTVVVFLRGMNLGRRRLTNEELVSIFREAGHLHVSAYQASGNVILGEDDAADPARISQVLADSLGYEVPVMVRTAAELAAIAAGSPLAGRIGSEGGKPQIVFLGGTAEVEPSSVFPDEHEVHLLGRELHWLPPGGLADTAALQRGVDAAFGYCTVRTLGTVERLAARTA